MTDSELEFVFLQVASTPLGWRPPDENSGD